MVVPCTWRASARPRPLPATPCRPPSLKKANHPSGRAGRRPEGRNPVRCGGSGADLRRLASCRGRLPHAFPAHRMHRAEEEERHGRTPSGMPGAIALPEMEGEQRNEGTEKALEKYRNVREKSKGMGTSAARSKAVSSKSGEPPPCLLLRYTKRQPAATFTRVAAGCHVKGPVALRRRLSTGLPNNCGYYTLFMLYVQRFL